MLPVSCGPPANPLFLLLPKNVGRPLGILATSIIDTDHLPAEIARDTFRAEGIVGTAILRGRTTLLLDLCRLAELSDPAGVPPSGRPADRRIEAAPGGSAGMCTGGHAPSRSPRGKAQSILVVDDTEFFRELVRGYLEEEGYQAITAADGAAALRQLESGTFDLVVSDIEMPVMDGWTLATTVRQRPDTARLPLLALTTLGSDADRTRARECGFNGYEVQLDRQQFLRTVARLLARESQTDKA